MVLTSAPPAGREELNTASHHSAHPNASPPSTPGTHIPGHCCKMRLWSSSFPECHHILTVCRALPSQLPQQQRKQLSAQGAGRGRCEMAPSHGGHTSHAWVPGEQKLSRHNRTLWLGPHTASSTRALWWGRKGH